MIAEITAQAMIQIGLLRPRCLTQPRTVATSVERAIIGEPNRNRLLKNCRRSIASYGPLWDSCHQKEKYHRLANTSRIVMIVSTMGQIGLVRPRYLTQLLIVAIRAKRSIAAIITNTLYTLL